MERNVMFRAPLPSPFLIKKKKTFFFYENMCIELSDCVMTKKKTDVGGLKALN